MVTKQLPIVGFAPREFEGKKYFRVFCQDGKDTINVKSASEPTGGFALIEQYKKGEQPDWADSKLENEVNVLKMITNSKLIRESLQTKLALAELADAQDVE
jgi:hypothetical protein